ncbi:MAG: hypothetical protein MK135_04770 [Polyangiaceae bacterium]|nr:hypothetical protein [Polyangiaceae bacterium]
MAAISGIGAWYPDEVRHNSDWPDEFSESRAARGDRTFNDIPRALDPSLQVTDHYLQQEALDPFLGVKERRFASLEFSAAQAEERAARLALEDAGLMPHDLDCIISYSAVPDRITPPTASRVAELLGVDRILSWGMDVACATGLVQIQTAAALIDSGQAEHVLLTQSHLMLRTFPLLHPASPGLGDASTAIVLSRDGRWPVLKAHAVTETEYYPAVTWIRAESRDDDAPWWDSGSPFRVGTLDKEGAKALQRDTVGYGVQTLSETLTAAGVAKDDLRLLASAEPRGWIPRAILKVLGLSEDLASSVYRQRAHLGACGCIANLEKAHREGRTKQDGVAALYAQGAGFTRAAVLLQLGSMNS